MADKDEIEAVLSLWLFSVADYEQGKDDERITYSSMNACATRDKTPYGSVGPMKLR